MLLYHNKTEYSRVVEILDVTEEGLFLKDGAPDDYAGAILQLEVVHQITLTDASGYIEILKLDNPVPLNKEKEPATNPIHLDGKEFRPGTGDPRTWTTKPAPNLPADMKTKADLVLQIMKTDGDFGTSI